MPGFGLFWFLIVLSAALLAALVLALRRVYALELADPKTLPESAPEGWIKLDEILSMLLTLQDLGVSRSGAASREDFGRAALDCACRLMKCARGSVMIWDEKAGCLNIVAARSPRTNKTQRLFLKSGEGVAGKAFACAAPIFVADPAQDPRYLSPTDDDTEPFVSIPLLVKGKPIGVLNLHAKEGAEPFSDYNVKFLSLLAGEAAVTLHTMDLLDGLRSFHAEMVMALSFAADIKDPRARERADWARARARRMAQELGLPEESVRDVEHAALLRGLGKLGVEEAILLKPSPLTTAERERVRRYPAIGRQILSPARRLDAAAHLVLHHQERYDGRGYPAGLKGEEIPLGARIVAVIDAWDAMTSDRPYRKAYGREVALDELKKGAGTQFDPRLVDSFVRLESAEWTLAPDKESRS